MRKTRQAAGDTDDLSDTLTKGGTMNKTSGRGHTTIPWGCQPNTEISSSMAGNAASHLHHVIAVRALAKIPEETLALVPEKMQNNLVFVSVG
jgi:hypothetical protein